MQHVEEPSTAMSNRHQNYWMWAEACELLDRAERLQRQFFRPTTQAAARVVWEPPADVFETADAIWIMVALPGVSSDQVELRVEGGQLVVRGSRSLPDGLQGASILRMEIPSGRFERRFDVPLHHFDSIQQQTADGCLLLRLRKPANPGRNQE